ncbi:MAG TPA: hypothetical protein VGK32_16560 [Vicinamibacterales bacterium]|jgi:hypothetical protein
MAVDVGILSALSPMIIGCSAGGTAPGGSRVDTPAVATASGAPPMVFTRYVDQTEGAFLVMVPKGWSISGGMVRLNPLSASGGVGNATEAKIDFAIQREREGRVAIRWLPKINYAQPSPYNAMLGGNWNGMPVVAMPRPAEYLMRMLFPRLRPGAQNVQVLETQDRPDVVAALNQLPVARTMRAQGARYVATASTVRVAYTEGGIRYQELLFVALEGYQYMGAALWANPFTIVARAPDAEYASYGKVAKVVINSFALNPGWLQAEMQGQIQRSRIVEDTLRDISRIDAEIARSRSDTMSRINQDQYLTLTNQERYVNPHTGREELGSNEWKHRWQNSAGEVIYADDGNWDPNLDSNLRVSGFQRSPVRSR